MITIGLTGGIASGKSVVAQMLGEHGSRVYDVDRVAHETYRSDTPGFGLVRQAFGQEVVGADGEIDRRALGAMVFGRPDELKKLTDIVWPLTRAKMEDLKRSEAAAGTGVMVLEAAVLVEANWMDLMDEVWVVTVPVHVARERLIARNGITADQANARIASQITNEERTRHASVVIDNSGDLDALRQRVSEAWNDLTARTA